MRRSLDELEQAFEEEAVEDRERREALREQVHARFRRRHVDQFHKHATMRFALIMLALIATAVVVTVVMFETLYYVMG